MKKSDKDIFTQLFIYSLDLRAVLCAECPYSLAFCVKNYVFIHCSKFEKDPLNSFFFKEFFCALALAVTVAVGMAVPVTLTSTVRLCLVEGPGTVNQTLKLNHFQMLLNHYQSQNKLQVDPHHHRQVFGIILKPLGWSVYVDGLTLLIVERLI